MQTKIEYGKQASSSSDPPNAPFIFSSLAERHQTQKFHRKTESQDAEFSQFSHLLTCMPSAHRSLGITNRALWLEWWASDQFGVKGFYSTQHFQSFGNDEFDIASRHVGGLFKGRFPINPEWQVTAGIGMAQSVTQFPEKSQSSNMLVSEFRMGVRVYENWTTELSLMTLDGASGDAPEDSRLGSTNYLIGIGYGF